MTTGSIDVIESTSPSALVGIELGRRKPIGPTTPASRGDPASITRCRTRRAPAGLPPVNGVITINGVNGALTVLTTGPSAGRYSYSLRNGVLPSCAGTSDASPIP